MSLHLLKTCVSKKARVPLLLYYIILSYSCLELGRLLNYILIIYKILSLLFFQITVYWILILPSLPNESIQNTWDWSKKKKKSTCKPFCACDFFFFLISRWGSQETIWLRKINFERDNKYFYICKKIIRTGMT